MMIGIGPHVTTSLGGGNRSSHVFGMDLAAAEARSRTASTCFWFAAPSGAGNSQLNEQRGLLFCILRSLPPSRMATYVPSKKTDRVVVKRFDGHPPEGGRRYHRRQRTFHVRVLVLAVCGLADCVARLLPKTTTSFWHGDCSWPPRHPSSHSVVATTNVALIGTCPSVHTYQRYVRPYIRPWYSGATGRLVGVVSREDITVYYGSYSTATSAAARISTIPYGSTRY
jgi:hypothetical protein